MIASSSSSTVTLVFPEEIDVRLSYCHVADMGRSSPLFSVVGVVTLRIVSLAKSFGWNPAPFLWLESALQLCVGRSTFDPDVESAVVGTEELGIRTSEMVAATTRRSSTRFVFLSRIQTPHCFSQLIGPYTTVSFHRAVLINLRLRERSVLVFRSYPPDVSTSQGWTTVVLCHDQGFRAVLATISYLAKA